MNEENKELIISVAIDFIEQHWDEINHQKSEIITSKEKTIDRIKEDYIYAEWIVQEVMFWGCGKNYLNDFEVNNYGDWFTVWKIKDKYFAIDLENNFSFKEVFPKEKTIIYFE